MKNILALIVITFLSVTVVSAAPGDEPEQIVISETVNGSFGKVWRSVKRSMEAFGCPKPQIEKIIEPAEEGGLYKGQYISDYCILSEGEDSTRDVIEKYSVAPRIRGSIWVTCRVQYKLNVKEEEGGKTKIILRAEMSGFEEFITAANHFWVSNGDLERSMMLSILKYTQEELQKSTSE
ncbi:MAG: hypothetical protein H7X70_00320 [Candidatus Kapabacteria bacterium]|nr:hypothetical protein [Candidatus Kapabacteria bacterium]